MAVIRYSIWPKRDGVPSHRWQDVPRRPRAGEPPPRSLRSLVNVASLFMQSKHISVCICTFKRPQLLRQLMERLESQQTENLFTYSVVVADNDPAQSAQVTVEAFGSSSRVKVT